MQQRNIVVIGASAGGFEAVRQLLSQLPPAMPAALFVVIHTSATNPSHLANILDRMGPLPVIQAEDQAPIRMSHIYVVSPDHHLLLEPGWMRVTHGPKENRFRPAIDPLFRSAAYAFGPRVIGIVLSGMLDDGTAGLWAIKDRGGVAIVQEPSEALYPSMPQSTLRHVAVDYQLPINEMATLVDRLVRTSVAEEVAEKVAEEGELPMSDSLAIETKIALEENTLYKGVLRLGKPSIFTCPECHGVLVQIEEGNLVRFRCHTGHAYSQETLLAEIDEMIELELWSAVRAMDEKSLLLRQLAQQAGPAQDEGVAQRFVQKAVGVDQRSQIIRQFLMNLSVTNLDEVDPTRGT